MIIIMLIYKFKFFSDKYLGKNAEFYYNSTVSLPIYYGLKAKEQNLIINKIKSFFSWFEYIITLY